MALHKARGVQRHRNLSNLAATRAKPPCTGCGCRTQAAANQHSLRSRRPGWGGAEQGPPSAAPRQPVQRGRTLWEASVHRLWLSYTGRRVRAQDVVAPNTARGVQRHGGLANLAATCAKRPCTGRGGRAQARGGQAHGRPCAPSPVGVHRRRWVCSVAGGCAGRRRVCGVAAECAAPGCWRWTGCCGVEQGLGCSTAPELVQRVANMRRGGVEMRWGGRLGGIGWRGVGAEE